MIVANEYVRQFDELIVYDQIVGFLIVLGILYTGTRSYSIPTLLALFATQNALLSFALASAAVFLDQENKIAAFLSILLGISKIDFDFDHFQVQDLIITLLKLSLTLFFLSKKDLQITKKVYTLKNQQAQISNYILVLIISLFLDVAFSFAEGDQK